MSKRQFPFAMLFAAAALAATAATAAASARGSAQEAATEAAAEPAAEPAAVSDPVAVATRFLDRFDAGDFEGARADFNAQMAGALDAGQLAAVHAQLEQAGPAGTRGAPQVTPHQGMQVVVFPLTRGATAINATVTVDGDGRIAGVFFTPAQAGVK